MEGFDVQINDPSQALLGEVLSLFAKACDEEAPSVLGGQHCPVCQKSVRENRRYPRYLCASCAAEAMSEDGRTLEFYNKDLSGGYMAEYADTHEPYDSHVCFVQGHRCWADEARFGGIVIQAEL